MLAIIGGLGAQELIIIFLIVLLLFGGKKIPEIARGLGKGMKEFKNARDDIRDSIENSGEEEKKTAESEQKNEDSAKTESDDYESSYAEAGEDNEIRQEEKNSGSK